MWKITIQGIVFHKGEELPEVLKVAEGLRKHFLMEVKVELETESMEENYED